MMPGSANIDTDRPLTPEEELDLCVDLLGVADIEIERLQKALRAVLVETNFISLQAARSYIREVLGQFPEEEE